MLLVTVGDGTSYPAALLASCAGLAPTPESSGTSIHVERAPGDSRRQLKRAMFVSAFAALHDPASRTNYGRCRNCGKTNPRLYPAWPANASVSRWPCSETAPSTKLASPKRRPHAPAERQVDPDQHHVSSAYAEISVAPRGTASS